MHSPTTEIIFFNNMHVILPLLNNRVIFIGGLNRDYGAILANDKYSSVRYTENGSVWTSKSSATRYTLHRQRCGLQASDDPTAFTELHRYQSVIGSHR
jgi:hypothetical protein